MFYLLQVHNVRERANVCGVQPDRFPAAPGVLQSRRAPHPPAVRQRAGLRGAAGGAAGTQRGQHCARARTARPRQEK